jgi:energy-converting hydrogenase B subunit D
MFWVVDFSCLGLILASAVLVLRIENLSGAVTALSAMGTVLTVLFVVLGAPDDAHAEAVVGAIALPVLYLVAIGKTRTDVPDPGELGEADAEDTPAVRPNWSP